MKKFFSALALLSTVFIFSACVSGVNGRIYPGNPFTHDKLISQYQCSVEQALNASREVIKHNGEVISEDPKTGILQGKVDQRKVNVKVSAVDEKISQITLQVLSSLNNGDIQLASELNKQIAVRLATGQ